ncbi:MAG: FeoB-associated Cys-rich membrane protein [Clostridia bacterium]|nr:FeoB-associated Cys-rich membrane protein [Clostridia bacterium]
MKFLDYAVLLVIFALLYTAVRHTAKKKGACSGNCAECGKKCK